MTRPRQPAFGIIGGGLSGSLLAIQLLRRLPDGARVHLMEKRGGFGPGQAYSTSNPHHLLNVPAKRMSAFDDLPDDFVAWLDRAGDGSSADGFVPRSLYGRYVQQALVRQMSGESGCRNLFLFPDEAVAVRLGPRAVIVRMECGRDVTVDAAVLCVGNFAPETPDVLAPLVGSPRYLGDPWDERRIGAIAADARVLVLGSGLTMVDLAVCLARQGHRGPIVALSRRGLLPHPHSVVPVPPVPWTGDCAPLSALLHRIRRDSRGQAWRAVVDGLRPHLSDWWQSFDDQTQRRFLRHARPWWDIHRHRMAPEVARSIEGLRADGRLAVLKGRLVAARDGGTGIAVDYRPRGGDAIVTVEADCIVNCSGPGSDFTKVGNPLLAQLLTTGLVRPDALGLGLDVDRGLHLLDRDGRPQDRLFAMGPVAKGRFWECTAVPEIRRQAVQLADHLAGL
jgi:uncharacterized NAD(P)/FAD-binding protein YdhS